MSYSSKENLKEIMRQISSKIAAGTVIPADAGVGHITWQLYLMTDYLKLDGSVLQDASTDYKDLLDFAQNNSLITSDTTDNSLFKYDSTTDVLTLPDYIDLVLQGGNTVEEKEAGLPNIKSTTNRGVFALYTSDPASPNDALVIGTSAIDNNSSWIAQSDYSFRHYRGASFDASKSNTIYSDSVNTVQPPAITLIPQIKYRRSTVYEGIDITGGGITIWETNKEYKVNNIVLYNNVLYKCKTAHTSSVFSSDSANWDLVYASIQSWSANTYYMQGSIAINSNDLYKCISSHTSSSDFTIDASNWQLIGNNGGGGGGSIIGYSQITKYDVTAPLDENISINKTTDFCLPPVEVLKFQSGTQDVVTNIFNFDAGDGSSFTVDGVSADLDEQLEFDGKVHLITSKELTMGTPVSIGDYDICESEEIDVDDYKSIEGLVIV